MDLSALATKHHTDKQPAEHNYTLIYQHWLQDRSVQSMLEIGLGYGASARMWAEAFPDAEIRIIELQPWISVPVGGAERAKVIIGNQIDPEVWKQIPTGLDFVVDDGSHYPTDVITSVIYGFDKLKPGGLWFIEDTHCCLHPQFNHTGKDILYPWIYDMYLAQQVDTSSGDFYKVRDGLEGLSYNVFAIHLYKSLIVLEKAL